MRLATRVSVLVVVALLALLPSGCIPHRDHYSASTAYTADWTSIQVPEGTFLTTAASSAMSESEYKRHCRAVSYEDFQKDLNAHKGEDVYFKAPVDGVSPLNGDIRLPSLSTVAPGTVAAVSLALPDVTDGENALVWFLWPEVMPPEMRTADGQFVEVWGECQGAFNYGSSFPEGSNMPVIRGRYMRVHTR
jgi:hypothetical protein